MAANPTVVVVEDDPWTRLIGVVLDPTTSAERRAAFADFMSPDEPDFAGWCDALRARVQALYPSEVRLVPSQAELRANLAPARALVVESFVVGGKELGCAPQLKVVHKYGACCATSMSRPAPLPGSRCSPCAGEPTSPVPSTPSR
jgi:glyoxylate reductase/D-3-phosphoglycerate dehydrogenase